MNPSPPTDSPSIRPCPKRPNCVSSVDPTPGRHIPPIPYSGDPVTGMDRLKQVVDHLPRTRINEERPRYLSVECRSAVFGFVDDVEFLLIPEKGLIHLRSKARLGFYDFGVNRRRANRMRRLFFQIQQDTNGRNINDQYTDDGV